MRMLRLIPVVILFVQCSTALLAADRSGFPDNFLALARFAISEEDYRQADHWLALARDSGADPEILRGVDERLRQHRTQTAALLLMEARRAEARKDWKAAHRWIESSLRAYPDFPSGIRFRKTLEATLKRLADKRITKARELWETGQHVEAERRLLSLGQYPGWEGEGALLLQRWLQLDRERGQQLLEEAARLRDRMQYAEAHRQIEAAARLRVNPSTLDALRQSVRDHWKTQRNQLIATFRAAFGRQDVNAAETALAKFQAAFPEDGEAFWLGKDLENLRYHAQASENEAGWVGSWSARQTHNGYEEITRLVVEPEESGGFRVYLEQEGRLFVPHYQVGFRHHVQFPGAGYAAQTTPQTHQATGFAPYQQLLSTDLETARFENQGTELVLVLRLHPGAGTHHPTPLRITLRLTRKGSTLYPQVERFDGQGRIPNLRSPHAYNSHGVVHYPTFQLRNTLAFGVFRRS